MTSEKEKFLKIVSEPLCFYCHDGRRFASVEEFCRGLKDMSAETFHYHSNVAKNDFSQWIKEVFADELLAEALWKMRERSSGKAYQLVYDRLYDLGRRLS